MLKLLLLRALLFVTLLGTQLDALDLNATDDKAAAYRTGAIDRVAAQAPAHLRQALTSKGDAALKGLVDYLVAGAADDYQKVKRIHDWITDNIAYDNDSFYGGVNASDPLRDLRATCAGFASLFARMSELAGVKAITISGRSRVTFDTKTGEMATHIWNAVQIGGKWYIVDTTHDDRFSFDRSSFGKKSPYRDTQLFIAPEAKILENFPDDAQYQFLPAQKSFDEFLAAPLVQMQFSKLGIKSADRAETQVKKIRVAGRGSRYMLVKDQVQPGGAVTRLRFTVPAGVSLFAGFTAGNGKRADEHALCHVVASITECEFSSPGAGSYAAYISAREKSSERLYTKVYEFEVHGDREGPALPENGKPVALDALAEFGVKIVSHNFSEAGAKEFYLELEYPQTTSVFSAAWDRADNKIPNSATASAPQPVPGGLRLKYRYAPRAIGAQIIKLRVKKADARLFNDTAWMVRIAR